MESQKARLYHLGARVPKRSTLADANALRPSAVFAELLVSMMVGARRGLRRKLCETTYLIDATGLKLSQSCLGWARFPLACAAPSCTSSMTPRPIGRSMPR